MNIVTKGNRLLLRFMVDESFRFGRHLLLFAVGATLAWCSIYVEFSKGGSFFPNGLLGLILLIPIYLNIFFFIPKFLFRNRVGLYVATVFLIVFVSVVMAFLLLILGDNLEERFPAGMSRELSSWMTLVNAGNSMVSILLISGGTAAIMLVQRWMRDRQRIAELETATIRSELEQLKNQINPHFLFNMLNNANVLVNENPAEAEVVLRKLRELLAYQFDESVKEKVRLSDEILFLSDFLKLESIRRDNFRFSVLDMGYPADTEIPPLLFIPFVENATKHGNDSRGESYVLLAFRVKDGELDFMSTNSKPQIPSTGHAPGGLGLANIRRRLELLYPERHTLDISETKKTYTVQLHIRL